MQFDDDLVRSFLKRNAWFLKNNDSKITEDMVLQAIEKWLATREQIDKLSESGYDLSDDHIKLEELRELCHQLTLQILDFQLLFDYKTVYSFFVNYQTVKQKMIAGNKESAQMMGKIRLELQDMVNKNFGMN